MGEYVIGTFSCDIVVREGECNILLIDMFSFSPLCLEALIDDCSIRIE